MLIKLCFNNETHLISKVPKTFEALMSLIRQTFKDKLPENFDVRYKDSDGDNVMIACDQDLEAMYEIEGSTDHTLKITISSNFKEISSSLDGSNIIIEKQPQIIEIVDEMNKMTMNTQEESNKPLPPTNNNSVTVKNYEPPVIASKPQIIQEKTPQLTEATTEIKKISIICKKCLGSGFNIKKNKECKRCAGKGMVEKSPKLPKVCKGRERKKDKSKEKCKEKMEKEHHHHWKKIKENHLEKIKSLIDEQVNRSIDKLREELNLKKSREDFFQEKDVKPEPIKKVHQGNPSNTVIHERYTCDGCGVHPIVGVRYKCSVCRDFDYCEKCEETIEHEHAFLKIKHPRQSPKMIITALDALPSTLVNFFKGFSKKTEENKSTNTEENVYKEVEMSFSEGLDMEFPKIFQENKPEPPKCSELGFEIKGQLKVLPELIVESTNYVFISFCLRNSGNVVWPEGLCLENINKALKIDGLNLPALEPNEEISLTLVVENPKIISKHEIQMEICSKDKTTGEKKVFFDGIKAEFEVVGIMKKSEKNKEEEEEAKIDKEILKKAESLKEIFGGKTRDFIEICEKFKEFSIDSLAEQVLNDRLLLENFSKVNLK